MNTLEGRSYRGVQAVTCVRLGPNWRLAARGLLGIHSDPGRPFARATFAE